VIGKVLDLPLGILALDTIPSPHCHTVIHGCAPDAQSVFGHLCDMYPVAMGIEQSAKSGIQRRPDSHGGPILQVLEGEEGREGSKTRSTPLGTVLPVVKNVPEAMWYIENALGPTGRISN
jgi:hypothetical protein